MGIAFDLAEAINIAVATTSGGTVASIQQRVHDWSFRKACADACQAIPELSSPFRSDLRALFGDTDFVVAVLGGNLTSTMSDPRAAELFQTLFGHLRGSEIPRVGQQIADILARKALEQADPMDVLFYSELQQQGLHMRTALDRLDQIQQSVSAADSLPSPDLTAEAALKGPIEALGLSPRLRRAETIEDENPSDAAHEYRLIAESLSSHGWHGHEWIIRRRMAKALTSAGDHRAAGMAIAELSWTYLDLGADHEVSMLARDLVQLAKEATDHDLQRWSGIVQIAHESASDPFDRLDRLARAVDGLPDDDPFVIHASVLLSELAIASEQFDFVRDRIVRLRSVGTRSSGPTRPPAYATRLQICLAEATDDWSHLLSEIDGGLPSQEDAALVVARHGRYLAWHGDAAEARSEYDRAIEIGVLAKLNEDASEWIHAIRYVTLRYGPITDEINEAYRRIQALRMAGETKRLMGHLTDPLETGLRAMHEEKYPSAADSLRRYLRECVVAGHWGSEFAAHELLGDLFARTGERETAAVHFVRTGAHKKLEALLESGPYVDLTEQLERPSKWERAAAYRALVAEADFVPDDQIACIVSSALADASAAAGGQAQRSPAGPQLWESAVAAVGAFVGRASEVAATDALDLLEPLVVRDEGKYRHTDKDHMRALAAIAREHPGLRQGALSQLMTAMAQGDTLASEVLRSAADLIIAEETTIAGLKDLSSRGVWEASLLLAAKGIKATSTLEHARAALQRTIDRPEPSKGRITFGTTLGQDSTLVSLLPTRDVDAFATQVMGIAEDDHESDWNRAQALAALRNVASELSPTARHELFGRALLFVDGDAASSQLDPDLRQTPHALSRFRFHLSLGPLEVFGLQAAARLASSDQETEAVIEGAWSMIGTGSEEVVHKAVEALASVNSDHLLRHQAVLAGQPHASLRALAAVLWTQDPNRREDIGSRLASDNDVVVRRTLAREVAARRLLDSDHPIVARLSTDERYSVRRVLLSPIDR